jgi:hypothetical protein
MNGRLIQKSTGLKQIKILSKFLISLSKMCTSPPNKNSSNLHESQELSEPLPKKTEISQNTENIIIPTAAKISIS